jgi:hypothetical protein
MFARIRGWPLAAVAVGLVTAGRGVAAPITFIAPARLSGIQTSHTVFGDFSWPYFYSLSFSGNTLLARVNIELTGYAPERALRNQWESGVEYARNRHHDVVDGPYLYPIVLNRMWVATSALADEIVTVHQGSGYMDILYWYTSRPSGWPDSYEGMLAGHEVGHMIGIYDEYYGGAANPSPFYTTADLGPVQARYYTRMVDWLEVTSGRPSLNPAADSAPEPAAATLIAIGILGVLASRPKSTRM